MKAKRKLLNKNHGVAAGIRLQRISEGSCHNPSSQEHILNESPLRAPQVALEHVPARTYTHSNPLLPRSAAFFKSIPGLHSNGSHLHSDCVLQQCA